MLASLGLHAFGVAIAIELSGVFAASDDVVPAPALTEVSIAATSGSAGAQTQLAEESPAVRVTGHSASRSTGSATARTEVTATAAAASSSGSGVHVLSAESPGLAGTQVDPLAKIPSAPAPATPKNIPHEPDLADYLARPDPHLPDAVNSQRRGSGEVVYAAVLCVSATGNITSVRVLQGIPGADDAIRETLLQWRLKPQPLPICYPLRLVYTIE